MWDFASAFQLSYRGQSRDHQIVWQVGTIPDGGTKFWMAVPKCTESHVPSTKYNVQILSFKRALERLN